MDQAFLDVIRLKVGALRVPEAKEVLEHLKLPRTGRKDELIGRILTIFQDAANLTAQGHQLRDQGRVDAAAAIVDSVFQRAVRAEYVPAVAAATRLRQQYPNAAGGRGADGAAAAAAAAGGGGGGGAGAGAGGGGADADGLQPNKRLRLTPNGLLPQHQPFRVPGGTAAGRGAAAAAAGGGSDVDEVITAFMNGDEGVGLLNTRVRCVCSDHNPREPMLQCEGAFCGVWQHAGCVKQQLLHSQLQPPPVGSDKWPKRRQFFCERCRVARADPFWEVYDALVMPPQQGRPTTGRLQVILVNMQPAEWTVSNTGPGKVTLTSNQIRLLREAPHEYQLQAMCVCLDDAVQFRMQWPTAPMLKFGPNRLRVVARSNGIFLGPMQRDAPANLTPLLNLQNVHGGTVSSDLCLEYADPKHSVLLLAYIMRKRTREQVKALMKPPEPLAAAVQRVRQCMNPQRCGTSSSNNPSSSAAAAAAAAAAGAGGGSGQQQQQQPSRTDAAAAAADDADIVIDDDDDDDIAFGNRVVSLKDPNTFSRIRTPARFTDTVGSDLMAFDLDAFLDLAESTRKWCDPHSNKASSIQCLQVDSYLAHILSCLAQQPDVLEVEVNEEAAWRPAGSSAPFRPVLDAAGAPVVPGAAAWGAAAAAGGAGGGDGGGGGGDSSDEEDEAAELRRAVSEVRRNKQQEVIEILDSDDDEDGGQGAGGGAAGAAGSGGTAAAQPQQRQQQQPVGLRIQLPSRVQQQQQHLQHQQQAASASMAAAAVGPHVGPHMTPGSGSGVVVGGGMRIPGVAGAGGGGGVMSPRVVTGNPQQQQQQQQFQQHMPPPLQQHQQQQQLPGMPPLRSMGSGDVLLQQQLSNNPPMQQQHHMQQQHQHQQQHMGPPPQQQYPHMQPLQQQHGGLPQGLQQLHQQQPPQQQQAGGGQPINTGLLCMGGQYYLPVANGGPVGMVAPPPPPGGGMPPAMGVPPHMQQQPGGVHQGGGGGMMQHHPPHHHHNQQQQQQHQGQQFPPPQDLYSQQQQQQPPPMQYQQQHQPPPGPPYRYC